MKKKILYALYIIFSLYLIINIFYWFNELMNDYDMRGVNDYNEFIINYTNDLKRFLIDITISYVMILFLTSRISAGNSFLSVLFLTFILIMKKDKYIKYLSVFTSVLFLYGSIKLIYENYYRNYIEIYELNSFIILIDKYGGSINLVYYFPLFFAIIYISFLVWMYLKNKKIGHRD